MKCMPYSENIHSISSNVTPWNQQKLFTRAFVCVLTFPCCNKNKHNNVCPNWTKEHNIHQQLLLKNSYATRLPVYHIPHHCLCTHAHHIIRRHKFSQTYHGNKRVNFSTVVNLWLELLTYLLTYTRTFVTCSSLQWGRSAAAAAIIDQTASQHWQQPAVQGLSLQPS